ncbi:hypothetical protein [Wolbachia endosymbiont of Cylisticus convexus]|uniref:hypothetical protein n=1 Tax=Wolbachia endosymbiont of Cylisticus convexus TaxID=118728 RepID=UPI0015D0B113|nr:hypothetical protein [Wolbachia endosymbiont of Cylisticus convexus]
MPKPYSEDLRGRVLKIVDDDNGSKMFKIDRKPYIGGREETGSIKPSFGYQKEHSHKIKDLDSLVKFVDVKRDIKVEKIIEEFGNMCKDTVYNYLKKVNYRYKKNFSLSRKG